MKYITITIPASVAAVAAPSLTSFEAHLLTLAYHDVKGDTPVADATIRDIATTIRKGRVALEQAIWDSSSDGTTRIYFNVLRKIEHGLTEAAKYSRVLANVSLDSEIAEKLQLVSDTVLDAIADSLVAANVNPITLQVA